MDEINRNILAMQQIMMQQAESSKQSEYSEFNNKIGTNQVAKNTSETTIYQNALEQVDFNKFSDRASRRSLGLNRFSSSSSEEDNVASNNEFNDFEDLFIADCAAAATDGRARERSGSTAAPVQREVDLDIADRAVREAEAGKARMFMTPGKNCVSPMQMMNDSPIKNPDPHELFPVHHHAVVDEEYLVVGGHIDQALQEKIARMEYIDFSRLIPRDSVTGKVDDNWMELINRGGATFFAPVSDREGTVINGFPRWEQAFRIYSNILTRTFPSKASKLIQYNHTIYTAAQSFSWDNVYLYDRELRVSH